MAYIENLISESLKAGHSIDSIVNDLHKSDDPEEKAWATKWMETASKPEYAPGAGIKKQDNITPMLDFAKENPKETAALAVAAYGATKLPKAIAWYEDRKIKKEELAIKRLSAESYAEQVAAQAQQAAKEPTHADVANMVKAERNVAGKPNPLAASFEQEFGMPLAQAEQMTGGKITNPVDAKIVGNALTKGQGFSVNPIPGTVSNQPAGVPGANPMDQLTTQPPAPQLIQPKPVVGAAAPEVVTPQAVAPQPPAQVPVVSQTPSVGEAVATNGNVDQAIKQTVANQLDTTAPQGMRENYKRSKTEPIGPGAFNHLANNVGLDNATKIWQEVYGQKNVPYAEYMAQYSKAAGKEMQGPVRPLAEGAKPGGSFGTPKYIPEYIKGSASPQALMATAAASAIPALAAAGYQSYKGNKEKVDAELKDAWESMKSVVTMPVHVAKAASKGDFGPFKDLLMSINPGTLLMNEVNKRDEAAIQRMIQAEKVGADRGIAPPSAYQR